MTPRRPLEQLAEAVQCGAGRVLVVAADPVVRRALIEHLEGLGYQVRTAATLRDAAAGLAERWPEIVVLADPADQRNGQSQGPNPDTA
ncbi:MAG: hypothetical protein U9R79_07300 [Armatimonadota bacterium]|nr:hypothetical protein [Armatimonadota bacterium]